MKHYSVMKKESIDALNIKPDGIYVDGTLGYAGHSSEILKKLTSGHLYCFDQDKEAIKHSQKLLSEISDNFTIIHSNFENLKEKLEELNVSKIDGILLDLGLSSPQIDDTNRGFSFMRDARLDMRMNQDEDKSAYEVVNKYKEEDLTRIFFTYGEEKKSKFIARKICEYRKTKEIETTKELVAVIESSVGKKYSIEKHPERQIFQAIRIEVNKELKVLETVLPNAIEMLNKGGRISVITFHSLEDRIVKQVLKKASEVNEMVKGLPIIPEEYKPILKLINKKPLLPTESELLENSRSKSAKLRVGEKVK